MHGTATAPCCPATIRDSALAALLAELLAPAWGAVEVEAGRAGRGRVRRSDQRER